MGGGGGIQAPNRLSLRTLILKVHLKVLKSKEKPTEKQTYANQKPRKSCKFVCIPLSIITPPHSQITSLKLSTLHREITRNYEGERKSQATYTHLKSAMGKSKFALMIGQLFHIRK